MTDDERAAAEADLKAKCPPSHMFYIAFIEVRPDGTCTEHDNGRCDGHSTYEEAIACWEKGAEHIGYILTAQESLAALCGKSVKIRPVIIRTTDEIVEELYRP